jgi:alcohol dehydrogenase class IV
MAIEERPDLVIGIGGGSSMDIAKVVAYWAGSGQDLQDMWGIEQLTGERLPLIQIPTTAGTGSEATKNSILKKSETEKGAIVSYKLLPDIAVLDAETTYGLPPHVTAMTGVDAMIHALEAYTGKNLKNPLSDIYARSGLEIMSKNLLTCMNEPLNPEARSAMLYGSYLAATAFCNSPVSGVHALAYPLALKYHVPHGLSNSLMLPEVMRFNAPACGHQYDEILSLMHDVDPTHLGDIYGQGLIWYFEDLIEKLGLPYNLKGISTP